MAEDFYEILGITRNASQKEIESAYRQKAREYHPDLYRDNPLAHLAEDKMKLINEAYSVLKDPQKRRDYDNQIRGSRRQTTYKPSQEDYFASYGGASSGYTGADEWRRTYHSPGPDSQINEFMQQALSYFNAGQYAQAVNYFDMYLRKVPDDPVVHNIKGVALLELRQYRQASLCFKNALRLDPNNAVYHFNAGISLSLQENYHEAKIHFEKAVNLDPNNPQYLIGLASVLHSIGQHMKAKHYADRARAIDPSNPTVQQYDMNRQMRMGSRREYYGEPCLCTCCPSICDLACCYLCCDCLTPGCGCCVIH
jgi:curved DNA-binding protein CbpA